jgi:translation initiation factor 5A
MSKPVEVGSLKIGQYVLIDGEPCRIVEFEKSKPGKHGSAKARIVAISAFTGQKKNLISPVDGKAEVPLIDKRTGQVLSISGNLLQVMDMENYQTFENRSRVLERHGTEHGRPPKGLSNPSRVKVLQE